MPIYGPEYETWLLDAVAEGDLLDTAPENGDTLIRYMVKLNKNISKHITELGIESVSKAIQYIYSGWSFYLCTSLSDQWRGERTVRFYESLPSLYKEGFNEYCVDSFDENISPLNYACCNLWNLGDGLEEAVSKTDPQITKLSLEVLEYALTLENIACQRSALKGLTRIYGECRQPVKDIISAYLEHDVSSEARTMVEYIITY